MAMGQRRWVWVVGISGLHAMLQFALIMVVLMLSNPHGGGGGWLASAAFYSACLLAVPVAWIGPVLPAAWGGAMGGMLGMLLLFLVNSFLWGLGVEALMRRLTHRSD